MIGTKRARTETILDDINNGVSTIISKLNGEDPDGKNKEYIRSYKMWNTNGGEITIHSVEEDPDGHPFMKDYPIEKQDVQMYIEDPNTLVIRFFKTFDVTGRAFAIQIHTDYISEGLFTINYKKGGEQQGQECPEARLPCYIALRSADSVDNYVEAYVSAMHRFLPSENGEVWYNILCEKKDPEIDKFLIPQEIRVRLYCGSKFEYILTKPYPKVLPPAQIDDYMNERIDITPTDVIKFKNRYKYFPIRNIISLDDSKPNGASSINLDDIDQHVQLFLKDPNTLVLRFLETGLIIDAHRKVYIDLGLQYPVCHGIFKGFNDVSSTKLFFAFYLNYNDGTGIEKSLYVDAVPAYICDIPASIHTSYPWKCCLCLDFTAGLGMGIDAPYRFASQESYSEFNAVKRHDSEGDIKLHPHKYESSMEISQAKNEMEDIFERIEIKVPQIEWKYATVSYLIFKKGEDVQSNFDIGNNRKTYFNGYVALTPITEPVSGESTKYDAFSLRLLETVRVSRTQMSEFYMNWLFYPISNFLQLGLLEHITNLLAYSSDSPDVLDEYQNKKSYTTSSICNINITYDFKTDHTSTEVLIIPPQEMYFWYY